MVLVLGTVLPIVPPRVQKSHNDFKIQFTFFPLITAKMAREVF